MSWLIYPSFVLVQSRKTRPCLTEEHEHKQDCCCLWPCSLALPVLAAWVYAFCVSMFRNSRRLNRQCFFLTFCGFPGYKPVPPDWSKICVLVLLREHPKAHRKLFLWRSWVRTCDHWFTWHSADPLHHGGFWF